MMKMVAHILVVVFVSITSSVVYADDPSPLQDICVADLNSKEVIVLQSLLGPGMSRVESGQVQLTMKHTW
ncbi:hypothetical protein MRB53_006000 [Persea americana]|uniref:Uncharacterized protein n=1 Tax=Persea americana TaxID=3435 RepID=A0ACC2MGH6_PERAE|nr:hypothetical protein MRB53_006000 [Persea americana]